MGEKIVIRWWKKPKDWEAKLLNLLADQVDYLAVIKRILEDQETRQLHDHLEAQQAERQSRETTHSLPATEPMADAPSGSNTFSETYSLVKADPLGDWRTTVTVTFHEPNFTPIPGVALNAWQDMGWTVRPLTTWESPSPSGVTPLTIPEHEAAGPTAGGSEKSPDATATPAQSPSESSEFHRIRWPDGGFWTYASHDIDAFMARCETCGEMVTLKVTTPTPEPTQQAQSVSAEVCAATKFAVIAGSGRLIVCNKVPGHQGDHSGYTSNWNMWHNEAVR